MPESLRVLATLCPVCSAAVPSAHGERLRLCENCRSGKTPSPCNKDCALDDDGRYCVGCLRTGREIQGWAHLTPYQRSQVYLRLHQRASERRL